MKKFFNIKREWELIVSELNSPQFRNYTLKQRKTWFNSQLLLIIIEKITDKQAKTLSEDFYLQLKRQRSVY